MLMHICLSRQTLAALYRQGMMQVRWELLRRTARLTERNSNKLRRQAAGREPPPLLLPAQRRRGAHGVTILLAALQPSLVSHWEGLLLPAAAGALLRHLPGRLAS